MTSVRVLIVDDHEPFRRFICTALEDPRFRVIEQASNGLEAVRKAAELQPALILLDIGLSQLNGIKAAKRICEVAPHSRILFISQEDSFDVVQAALSLGALGYIHKSRVFTDLLPAIESVLAGRQFVSTSLGMHRAPEGTNVQTRIGHEVEFYSQDAVLIESVAGFLAPAVKNRDAAIVVATESHQADFIRTLRKKGIDVDDAVRKGTYLSLDASKVLATFMVNGLPDGVRFFNGLSDLTGSALEATRTTPSRVAIFGECVSLLCAEGNTNAAIRLEKLCNVFSQAHQNMEILCAYGLNAFYSDARKDAYERICKEHSAVRVQ